MNALTHIQAQEWCRARGIALTAGNHPSPEFRDEQGVDFSVPVDSGRRLALLQHALSAAGTGAEFLVWFTDWSVWPSGERMHMFEQFRKAYGENRPLCEVPAYAFTGEECEDAISFAAFGILFLWDVHVLTATGAFWMFVSHDECGWICSVNALPNLQAFLA